MSAGTLRRPEALLLGILCFGPLAFGTVEPWSIATFEILTILLAVLVWSSRPNEPLPVQRGLIPLFAFLIVLGIVQLFSHEAMNAPHVWYRPFTCNPHATRREIVLYASLAALLWCSSRIISDRRSLKRFAWCVFFLGVAVSVIGIIQKDPYTQFIYGFRETPVGAAAFGPYYNRNNAACLLSMSFLVGWGILAGRFSVWRGGRGIGHFAEFLSKQILVLALMGAVFWGIVATESRGALVATVAGLLLSGLVSALFVKSRAVRWGSAFVGATAAAGYVWLLMRNPGLLGFPEGSPLKGMADVSALWRVSMSKSAGMMFLDSPVFGVGLGAFSSGNPVYQESMVQGFVRYAHNDFIEHLAEFGLAGFLAACLCLGVFLYSALGGLARIPAGERRGMALGLCAAIIAFFLHSFFEFNFQIPGNALVLMAITGALGSRAFTRDSCSEDELEKGSLPRPSLPRIAAALCVALFLVFQALKPAVAQFYEVRAKNFADSAKPYFFSQAAAWDGDPKHHLLLAHLLMDLANKNPLARRTLLRSALVAVEGALLTDPCRDYARRTRVRALWKLGRREDALAEFDSLGGPSKRTP